MKAALELIETPLVVIGLNIEDSIVTVLGEKEGDAADPALFALLIGELARNVALCFDIPVERVWELIENAKVEIEETSTQTVYRRRK